MSIKKIQDVQLQRSVARIRTAKKSLLSCAARLKKVGEPLAHYCGRRLIRPITESYAASFELGAEVLGIITEASEVACAALNAKAEQYPSLQDVGLAAEAISEDPVEFTVNKSRKNRRTRQRANRSQKESQKAAAPEGAEDVRKHFHGEAGEETSEKSAAN